VRYNEGPVYSQEIGSYRVRVQMSEHMPLVEQCIWMQDYCGMVDLGISDLKPVN